MKPGAKNYTAAKADRELPIPAVCQARGGGGVQVGDAKRGRTPIACDGALICERCHKCLHHCECAGWLVRPAGGPPVKRRKKGDDPNQMALCEKPQLRTIYVGQSRPRSIEDATNPVADPETVRGLEPEGPKR